MYLYYLNNENVGKHLLILSVMEWIQMDTLFSKLVLNFETYKLFKNKNHSRLYHFLSIIFY